MGAGVVPRKAIWSWASFRLDEEPWMVKADELGDGLEIPAALGFDERSASPLVALVALPAIARCQCHAPRLPSPEPAPSA